MIFFLKRILTKALDLMPYKVQMTQELKYREQMSLNVFQCVMECQQVTGLKSVIRSYHTMGYF